MKSRAVRSFIRDAAFESAVLPRRIAREMKRACDGAKWREEGLKGRMIEKKKKRERNADGAMKKEKEIDLSRA